MNVVIACKLFQTVFPPVSMRKIQKKMKEQSNKQSQGHLIQPGLRPVQLQDTSSLHP